MLDLFTIFSKGGIVLWCFQGTCQSFTLPVNELIRSVILQVSFLSSANAVVDVYILLMEYLKMTVFFFIGFFLKETLSSCYNTGTRRK